MRFTNLNLIGLMKALDKKSSIPKRLILLRVKLEERKYYHNEATIVELGDKIRTKSQEKFRIDKITPFLFIENSVNSINDALGGLPRKLKGDSLVDNLTIYLT